MCSPSGDQSASSSILPALFVMFAGCAAPERRSSKFTTKRSLAVVAEPGSVLVGVPKPEAEAWKTIFLQSGDQLAELPRARNVCSVPSAFIRNRSDTLV